MIIIVMVLAVDRQLRASKEVTTERAANKLQKTSVMTGPIVHALNLGFLYVVFKSIMEYAHKPLVESLSFYGAYHQEPRNQAIHFVFVPVLLFSFLVYFAHHDLPFASGLSVAGHRLTYATVILVTYAGFYLSIDSVGGALYSIVLLVLYKAATALVTADRETAYKGRKKSDYQASPRSGRALKIAGYLQLLGWYMQLHPGHAVFEGVKPALLDGFGQSLSVAPLFAFYEGVWAAGLHTGLHEATQLAVRDRRKEMCKEEGATYNFCDQKNFNVRSYKGHGNWAPKHKGMGAYGVHI